MRAAIFITVLFFFGGVTFSQSETAKIWTKTYNSGMKDVVVKTASDNSGNIYAAGYRSQSGSMEDSTARMLLIKYNLQGELLWAKTFNSRLGRRTIASGLTLDDSGYAVICGFADTNAYNFKRALVVKYRPDGDTLWARYNGFYIHSWIYHDVKTDGSGNVFLSYEMVITIPMPGKTSSVVKYSSNGAFEWASQSVINTTNPLVAVNTFGSVFLGCITTTGGADIKITNFDNTGTQQWTTTYNSPNGGSDTVTGLICDPVSGDVIAFGSARLTSNSIVEIQTIKFSSGLGQMVWVKRTSGNATDAFNKIYNYDISPAGDVYICGQFTNNTTGLDGFLIRYNPAGNELYRKIYNYKGGATEEGIYSVDAGAMNEPLIAGTRNARQQTFVHKYSTSGGLSWKYEFNDSLNQFTELPVGIHRGQGNSFFVVNGYNTASLADINVTMFDNIAVNYITLCRSVNLTTVPGSNIYDTINVNTGTSNLVRLEVIIDSLIHPDPKDLTIKLRTPHNTEIELFRNSGLNVTSSGLFGTIFSDTAQRHIDSGSVTYTGYFSPFQVLEPLNSYSSDGDWVLSINNSNPGDSGTLKKWCLRITYEAPVGIQSIGSEIPERYNLKQNYPNPFNPVTNIKFSIPKSGNVSLKVYDILGREVAELVNEFKTQGNYLVDFNASFLASGIYFYKLETMDFTEVKKMVLVK
jgi:subtilisin-like proprotein convertase family protein